MPKMGYSAKANVQGNFWLFPKMGDTVAVGLSTGSWRVVNDLLIICPKWKENDYFNQKLFMAATKWSQLHPNKLINMLSVLAAYVYLLENIKCSFYCI